MKSSVTFCRSKHLWIFRPYVRDVEPFPLFWSNKAPSSNTYGNLDDKEKSYISWLLSDSPFDPREGEYICWYSLEHLEDFEKIHDIYLEN